MSRSCIEYYIIRCTITESTVLICISHADKSNYVAYCGHFKMSLTRKATSFMFFFFFSDIKIIKLDYSNIDEIDKLGED